jgi:hypothetical protein
VLISGHFLEVPSLSTSSLSGFGTIEGNVDLSNSLMPSIGYIIIYGV